MHLARKLAPLLAVTFALLLASLDAARAQETVEARVDKLFADYDRPATPGCALGVVRDGRFVYTRGYGRANLDYEVPLSDSSVFYMASVSKQFAAAAVVLAAKQGRLSLDDDIRGYLPQLPDYGKTITVRNLIHHTSGIRDYLALMPLAGLRYEDVLTGDELLDLIARQKELNFPPGSEYLYSNSGYVLLTFILERATGKSLREFADEHLFGPLEMRETHFHDDPLHPIRNRAVGYDRLPDLSYRINYFSNFDKVGDGGLYSSVRDLLRWDRSFYDDRLGIVGQLLQRGTLTSGDTLSYAFGLVDGTYRGLGTVEHGGSFMGYRTMMLRFPDQRFSVMTLCNVSSADPGELARRVADIYLADRLAPVPAKAAPVQLPAEQLRRWVGAYRHPESGALTEIVATDTGLAVVVGERHVPLELEASDRLRPARGPAFVAHLDTAGAVRRLRIEREGQPLQFLYAVTLVSPSPAELAAYAGSYASDELQTTYTLRVVGERLTIQRRIGAPIPIRPTVRDAFVSTGSDLPGVGVVFERDASGAVRGFSLQAGRVRNIRFQRR